jgi:hypothetical protein
MACTKTDPAVQWYSPDTSSLTMKLVYERASRFVHLFALLPERAAFSQASPSPGGLAQHRGAASADNHGLRVAEYSCTAQIEKIIISVAHYTARILAQTKSCEVTYDNLFQIKTTPNITHVHVMHLRKRWIPRNNIASYTYSN